MHGDDTVAMVESDGDGNDGRDLLDERRIGHGGRTHHHPRDPGICEGARILHAARALGPVAPLQDADRDKLLEARKKAGLGPRK